MPTNITGDTLLHRAVRENDLVNVQILVAISEVNLNTTNRDGVTPIYLALRGYFEKVIECYYQLIKSLKPLSPVINKYAGVHCFAECRGGLQQDLQTWEKSYLYRGGEELGELRGLAAEARGEYEHPNQVMEANATVHRSKERTPTGLTAHRTK